METINERIQFIVNEMFEGNISAFCRKIGVKQPTMNTILGERKSKPSFDVISNIINAEALKGIGIEWLITGKGNPFENKNPQITETPSSNKDIKILDIRVCAGHGIGFAGAENKVIGYVNIPEFAGCYGVTVFGDSMYDMYMSGDTIFVREILDKRNIDNGQPYVIITKEDRLLKMIHIDYKHKKVILSSYNNIANPDGKRKYPDMEIDLDNDVLHLYKVVGKLARTQM